MINHRQAKNRKHNYNNPLALEVDRVRTWTKRELAIRLDTDPKHLDKVLSRRTRLTPDFARGLAMVLGGTPEGWLHLADRSADESDKAKIAALEAQLAAQQDFIKWAKIGMFVAMNAATTPRATKKCIPDWLTYQNGDTGEMLGWDEVKTGYRKALIALQRTAKEVSNE